MSTNLSMMVHGYLYDLACAALKRARDEANKRSVGQDLHIAIVFGAFTIEALLNYAGGKKVPYWHLIERKLGPREKLDVVSYHLDLELDKGTRPYQSVHQLFTIRDRIVHAKPVKLNGGEFFFWKDDLAERVGLGLVGKEIGSLPSWITDVDVKTTERYIEDILKLGQEITLAVHPDHAWKGKDFNFNFLVIEGATEVANYEEFLERGEEESKASITVEKKSFQQF